MKMFSMSFAALLMVSNAFATNLFELNKNQSESNAQPKIQTSISSKFLSFRVPVRTHGGTVSIAGPNGYNHTVKFKGSSYSISLTDSESLKSTNNQLPAGRYYYQIDTHVGTLKLVTDNMNNGRGENNVTYAGKPLRQSGSFVVKGGSIQQFAQIQEPAPVKW